MLDVPVLFYQSRGMSPSNLFSGGAGQGMDAQLLLLWLFICAGCYRLRRGWCVFFLGVWDWQGIHAMVDIW
ncbi:hypothetical protein [Salibacterium halotolerans]|uniref:hypothetical protein n=1 Tax=Salibacterium halotolerans TaxID=1884432 RepID=UPI001BAF3783|nr:hypothetical protein [Salibacterium halotolerans]